MMSGAGIDSGIATSREKIDISYANPREERIPMRKFLPVSAALVLITVASPPAPPGPSSRRKTRKRSTPWGS